MITVVVDRDEVHASDAPESVEWNFDDDASFRDLVVRIIDERFLPPIAGDVAWLLKADRREADEFLMDLRKIQLNPGEPLALIEVDLISHGEYSYWISNLVGWRLDHSITEFAVPNGTVPSRFHLSYYTGGARVGIEEFRR